MVDKTPPGGLSSGNNESAPHHEPPVREPSALEVSTQLEKMLASDTFSRADRLSRFLRFVVHHVLEGSGGSLKEYVVGVQVFEKGSEFDPRIDPIVRVEAGRLRSKLRAYYEGQGSGDLVRIELPRRGYTPSFRYSGQPEAQHHPGLKVEAGRDITAQASGLGVNRRTSRWYVAAAALTVLVVVASLYVWQQRMFPDTQVDRSSAGPASAKGGSLAVMPLANLSGQQDDEYLSDAITEAVITKLAQLKPLGVISLKSVLRYKRTTKSAPEIARELNVTHVLIGSFTRTLNRIHISVQLIDGHTNRAIWEQSYERDAKDVLVLQRNLSAHIAQTLTGTMWPGTNAGGPSQIAPEAYEAYAKGRYFRNQITADGFRKGIEYFEEAIKQQPEFAPAYSGMASCYCLLGGHGLELAPPHKTISAAKEAALRALHLDESLAEPHAVLGIIRTKYDWDWDGAERAFKRALDLEPSYAQAHAWYSLYLEAMQRPIEAVLAAARARNLDPLSLGHNINLAWQLHQAGRDAEALAQMQKTLELNPEFWGAHWTLGQYYREKMRYPEAIAELEKAVELGGGYTLAKSTLAYTYAIAGKRAEAVKIVRELEAMSQETYVSPAHVAVIYAGLGDNDVAFAWLEKAYLARARAMAWLNVSREWDGLRSDPRFAALLRKVGLKR